MYIYIYMCTIIHTGITFSLNGYNFIPTNGSGRIFITDIILDPSGNNNVDRLICRSSSTTFGNSEWILHPTQQSTDVNVRIDGPNDRGWSRNRATDLDGYRLVRLRRVIYTALEGVFTCYITEDLNSPRSVGVYYPSE